MGSTLGMQVRDAGSNPVLVQNFVSFLLQEFMLLFDLRESNYATFSYFLIIFYNARFKICKFVFQILTYISNRFTVLY